MGMKNKSVLFSFFALVVTAFIFYNSVQTAAESRNSSGRVVLFLMDWFARLGWRLDYNTMTVLVRKCAHITEFFVQGLFVSLAYFFGKSKFSKRVVYVAFFGLLTACVDELLQFFVDGRGSLVTDIWIDFSGVLLAVLFYFIISALSGKRRF